MSFTSEQMNYLCGIDLTTYFTYRFFPPSHEFQDKLDKFQAMMEA